MITVQYGIYNVTEVLGCIAQLRIMADKNEIAEHVQKQPRGHRSGCYSLLFSH